MASSSKHIHLFEFTQHSRMKIIMCISLLLTPCSLNFAAIHLTPIISLPLYQKSILHSNSTSSHFDGALSPNMDARADLYVRGSAYLVYFWLGTPVQMAILLLDTRSDLTWVRCQTCVSCVSRRSSMFDFDPSSSKTFKAYHCDSAVCRSRNMENGFHHCTDGLCKYRIVYGDRYSAHTFARVVSDKLTFPSSNNEFKDFIMGCCSSDNKSIGQLSGVLGLGRGPFSVQRQMNATAFSFCLVKHGSPASAVVNFYATPPTMKDYGKSSIVVPLKENYLYPNFYMVDFVGIGINGWFLDIPSEDWGYGANDEGGVIIDNDSIATHIPTAAYNIFSSELRKVTENLTKAPSVPLPHDENQVEFCFTDEPTNVYPVIEFFFRNGGDHGETIVSYQVTSDLIRISSEKRDFVCLAFVEEKNHALTVLGSTQFQGTQLTYDLVNQVLVFTPNKCK